MLKSLFYSFHFLCSHIQKIMTTAEMLFISMSGVKKNLDNRPTTY